MRVFIVCHVCMCVVKKEKIIKTSNVKLKVQIYKGMAHPVNSKEMSIDLSPFIIQCICIFCVIIIKKTGSPGMQQEFP